VCSKQTVISDGKYRFLQGLVANVADVHNFDEDDETTHHHHHHHRRDVTRRRFVTVISADTCLLQINNISSAD